MDFTKLDNEITALAANDKFSGCVQISNKQGSLFEKAYGYASRTYAVKNKIDTKFNIASVGKLITAVAVLQLAEKGVLDLHVPVTRYCGGVIPKAASDKITLGHLLTHTSGLGDFFEHIYSSSYQTTYEEMDDFMEIIKDTQLIYEPGSRSEYSNLGYLLLGFIIKNAADMDYHSFIEEHIFTRAQMLDSGFWFYDEALENAAAAYYFDQTYGKWRCYVNKPITRGTSCGGCYSTVGDLTRFMNAVFDGTLISRALLDEAITPKPELHSPTCGYGFHIYGDAVSHSGDGTGVSAKLLRKTDGLTIAILSNISKGAEAVESLIWAAL